MQADQLGACLFAHLLASCFAASQFGRLHSLTLQWQAWLAAHSDLFVNGTSLRKMDTIVCCDPMVNKAFFDFGHECNSPEHREWVRIWSDKAQKHE